MYDYYSLINLSARDLFTHFLCLSTADLCWQKAKEKSKYSFLSSSTIQLLKGDMKAFSLPDEIAILPACFGSTHEDPAS